MGWFTDNNTSDLNAREFMKIAFHYDADENSFFEQSVFYSDFCVMPFGRNKKLFISIFLLKRNEGNWSYKEICFFDNIRSYLERAQKPLPKRFFSFLKANLELLYNTERWSNKDDLLSEIDRIEAFNNDIQSKSNVAKKLRKEILNLMTGEVINLKNGKKVSFVRQLSTQFIVGSENGELWKYKISELVSAFQSFEKN